MNTGAKWGIFLGVGIPGVLILIGLIGLLVKFFMKRCRTKAWEDISISPKTNDPSENDVNHHILSRRRSSDRELLYPPKTNNAMETSVGHISIPIDENDLTPTQRELEKSRAHENTLVQIQRDRLLRLKEESRLKPMTRLTYREDDIQSAIDQAQKEFEESVATTSSRMKRNENK